MILLVLLSTLVKADIPRVTANELHAKLASGEAIAVDVRGSVPYEIAHLPGAVWMPLGRLHERAGELPEDKLLVMYCTCKAEETSLAAAMQLTKGGFPHVAVLHGGYPAWVDAGYPTESSREGEVATPAAVSCKDKLRKVSGSVTEYRRLSDKTEFKIDAETILLPGDDPARFFLVRGTPFMQNDWNRVEVSKGKLHEGMHATAWICEHGETIIDWQP